MRSGTVITAFVPATRTHKTAKPKRTETNAREQAQNAALRIANRRGTAVRRIRGMVGAFRRRIHGRYQRSRTFRAANSRAPPEGNVMSM